MANECKIEDINKVTTNDDPVFLLDNYDKILKYLIGTEK